MNWLLAIDCSDQACSVALGSGQQVLEEYTDEPRQHAQRVLPMMRQLLSDAGIDKSALDAIAVSAGPGSFTGLRIALSVAQGLSYALDRPLVTVSSLEALAMRYPILNVPTNEPAYLFSALDARMNEIYCAKFAVTESSIQRSSEDLLLSAEDALEFAKSCDYGLGSAFGLEMFSSASFKAVSATAQVHASDVYRLGQQKLDRGEISSPVEIEPVYLRRENAWKKLSQQ